MRAGLGNVLSSSSRIAWTAHSANEAVQRNIDEHSSFKGAFMTGGLEVDLVDSGYKRVNSMETADE
jgi:hypothetical protein